MRFIVFREYLIYSQGCPCLPFSFGFSYTFTGLYLILANLCG